MAKSNIVKLPGPSGEPVVPFDTTIISVQFLQPTEVLNLGVLMRVTNTQAILTRADGGVYVSAANAAYNFRDFIPYSACKCVRFVKGEEGA